METLVIQISSWVGSLFAIYLDAAAFRFRRPAQNNLETLLMDAALRRWIRLRAICPVHGSLRAESTSTT